MATISRNLRMDAQLWADLSAVAKQDKRSLNSFVGIKLQDIVDEAKKRGLIQDLTKPTHQVKAYEQPQTNYPVIIPPKAEQITPVGINSFEKFRNEILSTKTIQEVESIARRIKNELLPFREKQQLEAIAKEHSKTMYND